MVYKCKLCGEGINSEDFDTYLYESNAKNLKSYYHIHCFFEKKTKRSREKWTLEQCEEYVQKYRAAMKEQSITKDLKDRMYKWIMQEYDIVSLPAYFFTKTAAVFNGTYKGLSKPIPVEDLFDMWQRKKSYLDRVWMKKYPDGKLNDQSRLMYDLAVLVGKYSSYLDWKAEKEIEKQNAENRLKEMNTTNYIQKQVIMQPTNSSMNISDILDEI